MNDAWKERFRTRVVSWTEPARARRNRALAASNRTGVTQLYAWEVGTPDLRQLTDRPDGTPAGTISGDGRFIYYVDDRSGDELGHWVRVPFEGGPAEDVTPDLPPYTSWDATSCDDGSAVAFSAASDEGFSVYLFRPDETGPERLRLLYQSESLLEVLAIDGAGERIFLGTTEKTGTPRYSLAVLDARSGDRIAELSDGPKSSLGDVIASRVSGDPRVIATSDESGDRRPLVWNPVTGERQDLPVGDLEGEVVPWDWSADGSEVLLCNFRQAVQRLFILDLPSGVLRALDHPGGSYNHYSVFGTWFGPDGNIVAQWQDATHARCVISLDRATGRKTGELLLPSAVPASRPWRSVSFESDPGQTIQAWLAVPEGKGPFPAVIETHGGPESVTTEAFSPAAQAWLDRGFCYLSVNYRGGTTFGRAFKEAIWGRLGEAEVRDIVAGRNYLVDHGLAKPDQIFLTGWSYGGYLTLHGLGTAPGLWAGGMAGVAVADWVSEYEDENEILRGYDRALFGGTPDEKLDAYIKASPLTYADQVDAPVLVIQGRNDTRCPARQVELYEAKLKELGKPIEVIWFDAGHAATDVERAIEHQAAILDFAEGVLSGRAAPATR
jgi:dipeptidyl aminopeptidase/acylaminoacyl peptidase